MLKLANEDDDVNVSEKNALLPQSKKVYESYEVFSH